MQQFLLLLMAAIFLAADCTAGRAAEQKPFPVSWVFETHTDKDTTPHSRVFLRVAGQRTFVAAHLTGDFQVIPRQEYRSHKIPAGATTACTGWWAGQGQDFYAIRRHGHWEVFRRDLDEQAPTSAYRRVKSIPVR